MTDAQGGAIIHVDVVAQGSDQGQLGPKIEQAIRTLDRVAEQTEIAPGPVESVAADGAYHDTKDLAELEAPNIQPAVSSGQANRKAPGQDPAHQASPALTSACSSIQAPTWRASPPRPTLTVDSIFRPDRRHSKPNGERLG